MIDFRDARPIKYIQYVSLGTEHTVSPETFKRERKMLKSKGEAPPRDWRYIPYQTEELTPATINLLASTEGDPLRKFCCRQCGECAAKELLEEGRFPDRIAWLRHHYVAKHPGMWGKVQPAVIPTEPSRERARILWTRESTQHRIEILRNLSLEEHHFASPWNKLPVESRDRIATYYETQQNSS